MNACVPALSAAFALIVACRGSTAEGPPSPNAPPQVTPSATPDTSCKADADCAWGELETDITSKAQCPCLFGCAHVPLNKTAAERRWAQYQKLCKSGRHGANDAPCKVDDCAPPPMIHCRRGVCAP